MGTLHATNAVAHRRLELAYVVDPDAKRARALADSLGATPVTAAQALADPSVCGVVVASSTDAHLSDSLAVLRSGKAVFCEKPLDLDAVRLRAAAPKLTAQGGPPLFVGFNRRFDSHYCALRTRIAAGEIGAVETLHIVNHDPAAPPIDFVPTSGGLFRDFTIHDFDTVRWLTGDEVVEVFASASCLVDPRIAEAGDVDTAKLILRTSRGVLCVVSNSRRSGCGYDQRIEVFGSKGALRVDNVHRTTLATFSAVGSVADAIPQNFQERYAPGYRAEIDHFADVLEGLAEPSTGYNDSLRALILADAAQMSSVLGRPIPVSEGA